MLLIEEIGGKDPANRCMPVGVDLCVGPEVVASYVERVPDIPRAVRIDKVLLIGGTEDRDTLKEAQMVIEKWRVICNTLRPHSALVPPNPISQPVAVM